MTLYEPWATITSAFHSVAARSASWTDVTWTKMSGLCGERAFADEVRAY